MIAVAGIGLAGCFKIVPEIRLPAHTVYWSFFHTNNGSATEQLESAALPLTSSSAAMLVNGTASNTLNGSASMAIDPSGRFWVLSAPHSGTGNSFAYVFSSPPTDSSTPLYTLALPAANDADHLTFDGSGNLWIDSYGTQQVMEFTGPFTGSGSLTPAMTITLGFTPSGLAMDTRGDLYVSNLNSSGTQSIAYFPEPLSSGESPAYYLNGLTGPGGIAFDADGNLYASINGGGTNSYIVRYNSNNLNSGSTPNVEDPTGLESGAYESNFAFDKLGNLYDADCGNSAHIYVYPLATQSFSSSLAPSVTYTDANISTTNCVWGITVR